MTTVSSGSLVTNATSVQYTGIIAGPGGLTVTGGAATNSGTAPYLLELGGVNTYSGTTTISNATVCIANGYNGGTGPNNVLPTTTVLNLVNNGWFVLNNGNANQTIAGLTGDATGVFGTSNATSATVLTIAPSAGQTFNFPGMIGGVTLLTKAGGNGSMSLVMNGLGTQILSGANNYGNGTTLNAGTLVLGNISGSALGTGNLTFNGGTLATLPGTAGSLSGTVLAGTAANYISPGGDGPIGTLSITSSNSGLTLNNLSSIRFDIQSTSSLDQINDAGSLGFSSASGAATIVVPGGLASGAYPLINFGTTALTNVSDFTLAAISGGTAGYSLALTGTSNAQLELIVNAVTPSGGTWNFNGSGSWSSSGNWSPQNVPNSGTVTFAGVPGQPTAPITVTLDGNQSAGGLVFNVSGSGYTLAQGTSGALTIGTGAGGSISVLSGTHNISAPVVLAGSLAVNTTSGGVLDLSGSVSEASPGTGAITLNGGELILSGTGSYTGGTTVNNGAVLYLTSPTGITNNTNLTVAGGGTFIYDPSMQAAPAANVRTSAASPAGAVAAVPEPGTLALLAAGLVVGIGAAWRRRKRA